MNRLVSNQGQGFARINESDRPIRRDIATIPLDPRTSFGRGHGLDARGSIAFPCGAREDRQHLIAPPVAA